MICTRTYKQMLSLMVMGFISFLTTGVFAQTGSPPVFRGEPITIGEPEKQILREHVLQSQVYQLDMRSMHQWAASAGPQLEFTVQLGREHEWQLDVQPKTIRSANFEVLSLRNGVLAPVQMPVPLHLQGTVNQGEPQSARLTMQEQFLAMSLEISGKRYLLERLAKYIPGSPTNYYIYYAEEDLVERPMSCGVSEGNPKLIPSGEEHGRNNPPFPNLCLDFLVTADNAFCITHGNNALNEVEAIHAEFQTLYTANDIGLTFTLSTVILLEDADPWPPSNSINDILEDFCAWRNDPLYNIPEHDLAHLFSGTNRPGGTVGIAYTGSTCISSPHSCGVTETNYVHTIDAVIVAHEVGHNMGAGHDGSPCPTTGFIMAGALDENNPPSLFSTCSKDYFVYFYANEGLPCASCQGGGCQSPPSAVCQNVTADLDGNGFATVLASALDGGTTGCDPFVFEIGGEPSVQFNCSQLGANVVTLTVTDDLNAASTCTATITVNGGVDTDGDGLPDICDDCPLTLEGVENLEPESCNCAPGYYAVMEEINGEMVITDCQICPPGFYCQGGIKLPCAAGSSQSEYGSESCDLCPPGSYSDVTGAIECTACPAGSSQSAYGSTLCNLCPPGYYSDVEGAETCTACTAGTFQPESGSTECLDCCAGTSSAAASTSCDPGAWSAWSACSEDCDGGEQSRTRPITIYDEGNVLCTEESETQACNVQPCPVDCVVSAWSTWSDCSEDCDGESCRTREILVQAQHGGAPCPVLEECVPCNESNEDSDCDGTPDCEDVCPGGDDDGPCNANYFPGFNNIPYSYRCGYLGVKVCHNGTTLCVPFFLVNLFLYYFDDFLGPCASCDRDGNEYVIMPGWNYKIPQDFVGITLVPNPSPSLVSIHIQGLENSNGRMALYDMFGREILSQELGMGTQIHQLDLGSLGITRGNYVVKVSTQTGVATTWLIYSE